MQNVHPTMAAALAPFAPRQTHKLIERDERRAIVDVVDGNGVSTRYLVLASPGPKSAWVARYIVDDDATLATARPGRYADGLPSWAVIQFAARAGLGEKP